MNTQRYVSPDLTHFVGSRKKTQREQYDVLKKILGTGRLLAPKPEPKRGALKPKGYDRAPYVQIVNPKVKLSSNDAYDSSIVCFCDIPLGDLDIHMRKYSRFGIAFTKEFLLRVGASPVMYIPINARPSLAPFRAFRNTRVATTARAFDEFFKRYHQLASDFAAAETDRQQSRDLKEMARMFHDLMYFLDINVLSHLKFFDALAGDWDDDNFYMEREWRVHGKVTFRIAAVRRIIVPERFSRELRKDFPNYDGEVVFAD